jgi:hypothetical protein
MTSSPSVEDSSSILFVLSYLVEPILLVPDKTNDQLFIPSERSADTHVWRIHIVNAEHPILSASTVQLSISPLPYSPRDRRRLTQLAST